MAESFEEVMNRYLAESAQLRSDSDRLRRIRDYTVSQLDSGQPVSRLATQMATPQQQLDSLIKAYEDLKQAYLQSQSVGEKQRIQYQLKSVADKIQQASPDREIGGYPQSRAPLARFKAPELEIEPFVPSGPYRGGPNAEEIQLTEDDEFVPERNTQSAGDVKAAGSEVKTDFSMVTPGASPIKFAQPESVSSPDLDTSPTRDLAGSVSEQSSRKAGVSQSDLFDLSEIPEGALAALGGKDNLQAAFQIAKMLQPEQKPIDPALLAFQFFTNMAAEASKPGATALGAASTASLSPAQYLMEDYQRKRKAEQELPARALQIATMIKPPAGTGVGINYVKGEPVIGEDGKVKRSAEGAPIYKYIKQDKAGTNLGTVEMPDLSSAAALKPVTLYKQDDRQGITVIPGTQEYENAKKEGYLYVDRPDKPSQDIKTVGSGTLAKYMTREDAVEFVKGQGMSETHPNFAENVDMLTAPNEELVGKTITDGGVFLEIVPLAKAGEVINLQLTPSKTAAAPFFTTYVEKRLPLVAKAVDTYNTTAREVIPRVNEAMALLKSGKVQTGRLQQAMLPFKQVFNQSFGINDPEIMGLETLQATSNFLAPKMRPVGSGSTSDMEFRAYQQAALYIGNTPEANYISLYAFKKMAENGVRLNQLEQELLTSGEVASMKQVNQQLNEFDPGIFEKYTGDMDDQEAVQDWYDNLPDGSVFINNGLFDTPDIYIIKGWGQ